MLVAGLFAYNCDPRVARYTCRHHQGVRRAIMSSVLGFVMNENFISRGDPHSNQNLDIDKILCSNGLQRIQQAKGSQSRVARVRDPSPVSLHYVNNLVARCMFEVGIGM